MAHFRTGWLLLPWTLSLGTGCHLVLGIEALPDEAGDAGPTVDSAVTDAGEAARDADGPQTPITIRANLAACTGQDAAPEVCFNLYGSEGLHVDSDTTSGSVAAYLRFEIPETAASLQNPSVQLLMRVVETQGARSNSGGQIWLVESFDELSLKVAPPAQTGTTPIAPAAGAVEGGQLVAWTLPASTVDRAGALHLGVIPTSADGTTYESLLAGDDAPKLVIAQ